MHNQAQKQSMTLFGKLLNARFKQSLIADIRSPEHMRYSARKETPLHMASPPSDRHWRNSSPTRCYRYASFPRQSVPGRTYEKGDEAGRECWWYMYED
jgi:hypothetical protein